MNYLEKNKNQYLTDLEKLISIKSYLKDPNKYPNQEMIDAIKLMINLGEEEKFKTYYDKEGYYGYIEIGEGKELLAILGHLDVVPPGEEIDKWETDPFKLTIENNLLKARGVQDDKGPVMLGFYLLKYLNESNITLNKRIRLIFATDEESFWRGINKYKEDKQEVPSFGFTPDAKFPAIYSERELWEFKLFGNPSSKFEIKSSGALNVVPDLATYNSKNIELKEIGKVAHAMEPHKGENAIIKLINKIDQDNNLIQFIKNEINNETNGKTLFNKLIKDDDAQLTLNLTNLNINKNKSEVALDLRIPSTSNVKELKEIILKKIKKYNLKYKDYDFLKGVYIPKDSHLIKLTRKAYKEVMKQDLEPFASGGATYARSMDNIIAFGPYFEDSPMTEHQYNEYVKWSDFVKAFDIYVKLMENLLK